ncbi:MAG: 6-carboxytetrahydropterin synthase [Prevotellaceae bacterium]|jgi:6-pyruvoyltetrahydropterin/6-carboxytetrahydropterin synthase|nr:6-carboxytetrahydropterin synthase [Prevotellaceae bacterium]
MKYQISKDFSFEAAHRLIKNYSGKCSNNHGHSYRVRLTLEGEQLETTDMLFDFHETKRLQAWLDDKFDHATILWHEDPMLEMLQNFGNKVFITEKNPTAEHIAELIFAQAQALFENESVKVYCVEIGETCSSTARIMRQ